MAQFQEPVLFSLKPLKDDFSKHSTIKIIHSKFTIGRALDNQECIPCVAISRFHCSLTLSPEQTWSIRDTSRYGTSVNGSLIKKDEDIPLKDQDVIQLDLAGDFTYTFYLNGEEAIKSRKRKLSDTSNPNVNNRIQHAKDVFDSSQTFEIENMTVKLNSAKQKHLDIVNEKDKLEMDYKQKICNLESHYNNQISDLKGREEDVVNQKNLLTIQSAEEKKEIERKMKEEISKLEDTLLNQKTQEKKLEEENKILVERLQKEREEFQKQLEASSCKERKLECLEKELELKKKELVEKEMLESQRLQEVANLKAIREREIQDMQEKLIAEQENKMKQIESLKMQMEMQEHFIKENRELTEKQFQAQISELKEEAEGIKFELNVELAKRLLEQSEQESARRLLEEKLEREKRALEASLNQKEIEKYQLQELLREKNQQSENDLRILQKELVEKEAKVHEQLKREKEQLISLLALETETCNSTIKELQQKLEQVTSQMNSAQETLSRSQTKDPIFIDLTNMGDFPSTSSNAPPRTEENYVMENVNQIMESELQCSICADLFIEATTLNCSHTFCKSCIETWKKKKKECPVCRAKIKSQCHSIVLDSFIDKMVENMDADLKEKRAQILRERQKPPKPTRVVNVVHIQHGTGSVLAPSTIPLQHIPATASFIYPIQGNILYTSQTNMSQPGRTIVVRGHGGRGRGAPARGGRYQR